MFDGDTERENRHDVQKKKRKGEKRNLTIFGHLGDDVGYLGRARGLGGQQGWEAGKDAHLLDLHAGLCICSGGRGVEDDGLAMDRESRVGMHARDGVRPDDYGEVNPFSAGLKVGLSVFQ